VRVAVALVVLAGCWTTEAYRDVRGSLTHPAGRFAIVCEGEMRCDKELASELHKERARRDCSQVNERCTIHETVRQAGARGPVNAPLVRDVPGSAELVGHDDRRDVLFFTVTAPGGEDIPPGHPEIPVPVHLRGVMTHASGHAGRPYPPPVAFTDELARQDRPRLVLEGRAMLRWVGRSGRFLLWELGTSRVAAGDLGAVPPSADRGANETTAILCRRVGDEQAVEVVTVDLAAVLAGDAAVPSIRRGRYSGFDEWRAFDRCLKRAGATRLR
jgi:hypothetical protein